MVLCARVSFLKLVFSISPHFCDADRKPRRLTELPHYPKKQSNFMSSKTAASGVVVENVPLYTNNDEYVIVVATVRPLHLCVRACMSTCAYAHINFPFFDK